MKAIKKVSKIVGIGIATLFLVVVGLFLAGCGWIGSDVWRQCNEVKVMYGGDCVEGLSKRLQDDKAGFGPRNEAIWALGQLGDKRALPILEGLYTGNIPEREPLDKMISQYELKKAVKLAQGGLNISAPFWRWAIYWF